MKEAAKKLLIAIGVLLLSPVIIFGLVCAAVYLLFDWLKEHARKREYRQSHYYRDFQIAYHKNILSEAGYKLYNEAKDKNIPINMIHPSDNGLDYLIAQDSIFLFPMCRDVFGGICYHTKKRIWEVDFDGELFPLDDEWEKYKSTISESAQGMPCYLLIRQCELSPCHDDTEEFSEDYALDLLPPYVRVVQEYIDILAD